MTSTNRFLRTQTAFCPTPHCDGATSDRHSINDPNVGHDGEFPHLSKARLCHCIPSLPNGWRGGLLLNTCLAMLVLLTNVAFLAWASNSSTLPMECENAEKLSILSHFIVNVLSTVLLSASNYTMQVLSSPKRLEVDKTHQQGRTLIIGVQSFANLRSIGIHRVLLWFLLAISSLPLHLLYNSVLFPVTGTTSYIVAFTSPEFQNGATFSRQLNWEDRPDSTSDTLQHSILLELQQKAQKNELKELTKKECLHAYASDPQQLRYRNLIAISDDITSNDSVAEIYYSTPTDVTSRYWICAFRMPSSGDPFWHGLEDIMGQWSNSTCSGWAIAQHNHPTSRCLAEPITSPCALKYSRNIHLVVIAVNLVKVIAMVVTMFLYRTPALVTVGDAIASFLETPDPTTQGLCLGTNDDFATESWSPRPKQFITTQAEELRQSTGAPYSRWVVTSTMFALSGLAASTLFVLVYKKRKAFDWSFKSSTTLGPLALGHGIPGTSLLILANIPQLLISTDYLLFNHLITSMAVAREWSLFAHQRKGLRTSTPQGAQRSTYWLQLPLKISIPLMAASTSLHYLVSKSLYLSSVVYYDYYDDVSVDGGKRRRIISDLTGLGYSQTAVHILMFALLLPMTAAVLWGRRRLKPGMVAPMSGFNSAVISAACHPKGEMGGMHHLKPVQWGAEVMQQYQQQNYGSGDGTVGHCSFSSEEVSMPVVGREYA